MANPRTQPRMMGDGLGGIVRECAASARPQRAFGNCNRSCDIICHCSSLLLSKGSFLSKQRVRAGRHDTQAAPVTCAGCAILVEGDR